MKKSKQGETEQKKDISLILKVIIFEARNKEKLRLRGKKEDQVGVSRKMIISEVRNDDKKVKRE